VPWFCWRFNQQIRAMPAGLQLRLEVTAAARVHWTCGDGEWRDVETRATGLGIHLADLSTTELAPGATITFTFFWIGANAWEGRNFEVRVEPHPNEQEG
jgi:glucoamylase